MAVGWRAFASASFSTAMGYDARATASGTTAMGYDARATAADNVAIGRSTRASEGRDATDGRGVAIGHQADTRGDCIALGGSGMVWSVFVCVRPLHVPSSHSTINSRCSRWQ